MMVFSDITKEIMEEKLQYLKAKVKTLKINNHPEIHLSMSFGCALGTDLVNNMISVADGALYESKKSRDTYTIREI
jgi:GGDEF domain-containing protein